jgi:hypothetical protein
MLHTKAFVIAQKHVLTHLQHPTIAQFLQHSRCRKAAVLSALHSMQTILSRKFTTMLVDMTLAV